MRKLNPKSLFLYLAIGLFLSSPGISFADGECAVMKIVHVGMSSTAPSGIELWLQNQETSACGGGAIPSGENTLFYLSTDNTDKALALMLTAASLGKNVWTYYIGDAPPYTLAYVSVKDITD